MLKGLSNLASLMANAGELKARATELREKLADVRVSGSSGGGMVTVEASGDQQILSVKIEESLLAANDKEMLEDLLISATNQALESSRQAASELMAEFSGGLGIPGLEDALAKFGPG